MRTTSTLSWALAAMLATTVAACGSSDSTDNTGGGGAAGSAGSGGSAGGTTDAGGDDASDAATDAGDGTVGDPNSPIKLLAGDCDPMVPTECGFPFPSSVWLDADTTTVTGRHVLFGATTLPMYKAGHHIDPTRFADSDGFPASTSIITHIPGATITGLPDPLHIADSVKTTSPTILLDADTGELVPHFAELDMSTNQPDKRTFMIRPVIRLKDNHRYIVAIRHVVDANGTAIDANDVFKALRDGTSHPHMSVKARRTLYADIFGKLSTAGIAKDDLQIAWDYWTGSRENNTRWMLKMRDEALGALTDAGPSYTIKLVEKDPNQWTHRRVTVTMTVPSYCDIPDAGGTLVFGTDGMPKQNGTAQYDILVHIPNSAYGLGPNATGGAKMPARPLQNGHGLLGDKAEGQNGWLVQLGDQYHFITFGVDLVGMASDDENTILAILVDDIGTFKNVVGRQHQGLLNSLLAMRVLKGTAFQNDQALKDDDGIMPAFDLSDVHYRGDSQGGIFGTTYMSITTDVTRGMLGEPGFPYNLLLNRSEDFGPFFVILKGVYHNPMDMQLGLGLLQTVWERTEPSGYAPYMTTNMLPGTPSHTVLINDAIGDHQVTTLGAHLLSRTIGAKNLKPVNRTVYGIDEVDGPYTGNTMVEWNFNLKPEPTTNVPAVNGDDPHDTVRQQPETMHQTSDFLRTGQAIDYCVDGGAPVTCQCDGGCVSQPGYVPPPADAGTD